MTARQPSLRAGTVYVALAVLGEAFLLIGLRAARGRSRRRQPGDRRRRRGTRHARHGATLTIALLILGFGTKMGLYPAACLDAAFL